MPQQKITQVAVRDWRKEKPAKPYDIHDTDLKGFIARVRPSGTVTFLFKYDSITGKSRNYTIGRDSDGMDATKARDRAADLKEEVRAGIDPQKQRKQTKESHLAEQKRTLCAYFENRYKPHHLKNRSEGGAKEAERALRQNFGRSMTDDKEDPASIDIFDRPLSEVSIDDIEGWEAESEKRGRDSETIRRLRTEIESLYTHVMKESGEWKWLDSNPLAGLKPIKAKPAEDLKPRFLTDSEATRLINAMSERDTAAREKAKRGNLWRKERGRELKPEPPEHYVDHLEVMVIVSLKTGVRRRELFLLEWQDIEPDYSAINLRGCTTKSGRPRTIPLAKSARESLEKWRSQSTGNQLVFSNGGKSFNNVNKAWKTLLKRAQIDNFRWHDMRHDFASQLVIRDVSIQKVSKLLGHADIKTTQRYAHLSNDSLKVAVGMLD